MDTMGTMAFFFVTPMNHGLCKMRLNLISNLFRFLSIRSMRHNQKETLHRPSPTYPLRMVCIHVPFPKPPYVLLIVLTTTCHCVAFPTALASGAAFRLTSGCASMMISTSSPNHGHPDLQVPGTMCSTTPETYPMEHGTKSIPQKC